MPRDLGYRDVWENCYHSTYGRDKAMRYGERFYCERGKRIDIRTGQCVDEPVCFDWVKCRAWTMLLTQLSQLTISGIQAAFRNKMFLISGSIYVPISPDICLVAGPLWAIFVSHGLQSL